MRRAATAALIASVALACAGCLDDLGATTCDRSAAANPTIDYTGGDVANGTYSSVTPDRELLFFPGGMHYRIFHQLGTTPRQFQFLLSFEQYLNSEQRLAQAAGDEAQLLGADDKSLTVANGTCADFWLEVVASP